MIGSDILLVPDTGKQFARCLKTAALYCERIHCISSIAPRAIDELYSDVQVRPGELTAQYLQAAEAHNRDFALLKREGILVEPDDSASRNSNHLSDEERESVFQKILSISIVRYQVAQKLVRAGRVSAAILQQAGRNQAMRLSPPAAWQAIEDLALKLFSTAGNHALKKYLSPEVLARTAHDIYLNAVVSAADANGVELVTYADIFEQSLAEARQYSALSLLGQPEEYAKAYAEELRRRTAGAKLAQTIIARRLPRADDIPMENVLELRRKHKDEISAFRTGIGELSAQLDTSKPVEQDKGQIEQMIRSRIDPAVEDLKAAIKNSRLDMVKTFYGLKETAAAATVSVIVNLTTHGSTPATLSTGAIAILFPAVAALLSGHVEKKRIMNANRWSLLLAVQELD